MPTPRKGITKKHIPTDATRAKVSSLVSFGITHEQIAKHINVGINILDRYYRDELDNSVIDANAAVAAQLFRKATQGDDLGAMTFWLKTRARWKEKHDDQQSDVSKMFEIMINKLTTDAK